VLCEIGTALYPFASETAEAQDVTRSGPETVGHTCDSGVKGDIGGSGSEAGRQK
jgi:hypothetical protein